MTVVDLSIEVNFAVLNTTSYRPQVSQEESLWAKLLLSIGLGLVMLPKSEIKIFLVHLIGQNLHIKHVICQFEKKLLKLTNRMLVVHSLTNDIK